MSSGGILVHAGWFRERAMVDDGENRCIVQNTDLSPLWPDRKLIMRVLKPILRNLIFRPTRIAVVDDRQSWKGIQLYIGALHLARAIEKETNRERIGVMLPTSGLFPMALIATWMLGKTVVPLNYLLKREDLEYVIENAELDLVVTATKMLEMFGEMPDSVKSLKLDEMSFKGIPPFRRAARRPDDFLAVLLYTSGTSGKPKGVMLTSGNIASNVEQCVEWVDFGNKQKFLGVLPQFHTFGLTILTVLPMSVGSQVIFTARFMPKKILNLMQTHRPTVFVAIPSMLNALLSAKSATKDHFSSLTYVVSGGEPLSDAVFEGFQEKFGVTINEGYGLTETGPVTNWCRPQDHKRHSVGKAIPRVMEKIVDPGGKVLGVDEEGEICMKGPNVMKGYFKMEEETEKVFDQEGYFKSGDMGKIDAEGHLFITGRIKEMMIIGGENVFPKEIEGVLDKHSSVHASAVIGVKDESRGEVPIAFVELEEGESFDEKGLRKYCRESLPPFKVPKEIRCLEQLPRNPTGKIMRRSLSVETVSSV